MFSQLVCVCEKMNHFDVVRLVSVVAAKCCERTECPRCVQKTARPRCTGAVLFLVGRVSSTFVPELFFFFSPGRLTLLCVQLELRLYKPVV